MEEKIKNMKIIDDQNLEMMDDDQEDDDEDQHYPDEDASSQQEDNQVMNYDQLGDIDPELLEAAQKLGLDEDGIRMLQQQMYQ
jgi:hypothetical protein